MSTIIDLIQVVINLESEKQQAVAQAQSFAKEVERLRAEVARLEKKNDT